MSIYISHLYVEFYVELNINVGVVSFDLIDVIFDEKLVIGKNGDFSYDFRIYIGRKWFELWFLIVV